MKKLYVANDPDSKHPWVKILPDTDPMPLDCDEKTSIEDWIKYGKVLNDKELRDIFINQFLPDWATFIDDDKKWLVTKFVWPFGIPEPELDTLFTEEERDGFCIDMIKSHRDLGHLITPSVDSNNHINWVGGDDNLMYNTVVQSDLSIK